MNEQGSRKKRDDRPPFRRPRSEPEDMPPPGPVETTALNVIPAFNAAAFEQNKKYGYVWGTGRRKTSVARVRVRPGTGVFKVNDRDVSDYFGIERDRRSVELPLEVTETRKHVDVFVNVSGGGTTGQAGAIVLGVARALKSANKEYEGLLRDRGLLTRDARKVERKKYGQPGARRRFQFSKR